MASKEIGPYVERAIAILHEKFGPDDAEIMPATDCDNCPDVSVAEEGVWVRAWIWVHDDDVNQEKGGLT